MEAPKRTRGRPKGSKNKLKAANINNRKAAADKREQKKQQQEKEQAKRGRPPAITPDKMQIVQRCAQRGLPQQFIADLIGVSKDTLKRHCSDIIAQGHAEACEEVNNLTWLLAAGGNAQALLHLRRVLFGEHDKLEIVGDKEVTYVIKVGE